MGTGRVRDELPTPPDLRGRETRNQRPELIVRDGEKYEVGRRDNLVGRNQWHSGEPPLGPPSRRGRYPARGHDLMPGPGESRAEHAADSPGRDDPHPQSRGGGRCRGQGESSGRWGRSAGQTAVEPTRPIGLPQRVDHELRAQRQYVCGP
jgi:hypothetical protein